MIQDTSIWSIRYTSAWKVSSDTGGWIISAHVGLTAKKSAELTSFFKESKTTHLRKKNNKTVVCP
jgi:hypothetical protein